MPIAYVTLSGSGRPNPDPITLARRALRLPDTATADEVRAAVDAEHARLAASRPRFVGYVRLSGTSAPAPAPRRRIQISESVLVSAARAAAVELDANQRTASTSRTTAAERAASWERLRAALRGQVRR